MMRKLIRTDGSELEFTGRMPMSEIPQLLGAETLDSVTLHHLGLPMQVMICDDAGWLTEAVEHDGWTEMRPIRALKPINEKASALYLANCIEGTTHQIAGDVFVCPDEDFA